MTATQSFSVLLSPRRSNSIEDYHFANIHFLTSLRLECFKFHHSNDKTRLYLHILNVHLVHSKFKLTFIKPTKYISKTEMPSA